MENKNFDYRKLIKSIVYAVVIGTIVFLLIKDNYNGKHLKALHQENEALYDRLIESEITTSKLADSAHSVITKKIQEDQANTKAMLKRVEVNYEYALRLLKNRHDEEIKNASNTVIDSTISIWKKLHGFSN